MSCYCPLLLANTGVGTCRRASDCRTCVHFEEFLGDYDLIWLCADCLPEKGAVVLTAYYNEQECDACGQMRSLCQATISTDVMSYKEWVDWMRGLRE